MGMTGDFDKLAKLRFKVAHASRGILQEATRVTRDGVAEQYQADFSGSHSPWGETWQGRRDGAGGAPLRGPTGQLQATSPAVSGASIVRMRPPKYWLYHQIGANNMHQRQVLPFGSSHWDPPIQGAIEKVVLDYFDDGDP